MKQRLLSLPGAVAAVIAVIHLTGCSRSAGVTVAAPVRSVQVAAVSSAALDNTLRAVGLLTPKDEARLSFKVGGLIESIRVEEGQTVMAGQVLAVLKPAEINASLEQARQAAAKARRDLERGRSLLDDGVATQEQVQDLTTVFQVASAAQSSAEFNAAHARIVAAVGGVVLRKLAEANEVVQPGQTVVVRGGANRGWIVRVGLADRDVVRVRLGDAARIEFDAWPGQSFSGRVSNIASAADPATGTFTVEVQLDAAARLVRRINIQIGRMSAGSIEVLDGLALGEQVVTDGAAFLENGAAVRVAAQ
jgi:RND family efflux transporter MFP subunit